MAGWGCKRVPASHLSSYLCFHCGQRLDNKMDYDKHLVDEHLSVSLFYQIYHSEMRKQRHGKMEEDRDVEVVENVKSRVNERRKSHDKSTVSSASNSRRASFADVHGKKAPPPASVKKSKSAPSPPIEVAIVKPTKRKNTSTGDNTVKRTKSTESEKSNQQSILLDTKENTCGFCPSTFSRANMAVIHFIEDHDCEISQMQIKLFDAKQIINDKKDPPGRSCYTCKLSFETDAEYYTHFVRKHVDDVIESLLPRFPTTESFNVEIHLKSPKGVEMKVDVTGVVNR